MSRNTPGQSPSSAVVAIINSSPDMVEMLRQALRPTGMVTVSAMTYDIRDARVDWPAFLALHTPRVIVYDVAPPYDANWALFQHLSKVDGAKRIPFVLTSTNAAVVREMAGRDRQVFEVIGKPYDLGLIVNAVKEAAAERLL